MLLTDESEPTGSPYLKLRMPHNDASCHTYTLPKEDPENI